MKRLLKRVAWTAGGVLLAGTIATAFAGTTKIGPAAIAMLANSPDGVAFLVLGVGLLVVAKRRDRAGQKQ